VREQNDEKLELAIWRYGIISPLLHREANSLPSGELLDQASWQRYVHPNGSHMRLSAETLRKWLYRYLQSGLPGLMGKVRSDKGKHQIPDKITSAMVALREEHPRWTLARMIKELIKNQQVEWKKTQQVCHLQICKSP
jgi:putative transposase